MRGLKILYKNVWVRNVREKNPKDHLKFLEEGPKVCVKDCLNSPKRLRLMMVCGQVDTPSMDDAGKYLYV